MSAKKPSKPARKPAKPAAKKSVKKPAAKKPRKASSKPSAECPADAPHTSGRGWCIVRQPNGRFARYSNSVTAFTHLSMDSEAAAAVCYRQGLTWEATRLEIERATADTKQWDTIHKWLAATGKKPAKTVPVPRMPFEPTSW